MQARGRSDSCLFLQQQRYCWFAAIRPYSVRYLAELAVFIHPAVTIIFWQFASTDLCRIVRGVCRMAVPAIRGILVATIHLNYWYIDHPL